jgi:hypothetical protein
MEEIIPLKLIYESITLDERADDKRRREITKQYFNIILNNLENVPSHFGDSGGIYDFTKLLGLKIAFILFPNESKIPGAYYHKNKIIYINLNYNNDTIKLFKNKHYKGLLEYLEHTMIHELTHFLDFERHDVRNFGHPDPNSNSRVNMPAEFEAYYQSEAHLWDKKIEEFKNLSDPLKEFYAYFGINVQIFIHDFWEEYKKDSPNVVDGISQSNEYKFKWNKRLYQSYYELKDELIKKDFK